MLLGGLFLFRKTSFVRALKEDVKLSCDPEVFYTASGALFNCNGAYGGKVDHAIGLSISPD